MTATAETKTPVTMRALIQRINRKLRGQDARLQACRRNSRWWSNLGDLYVVDINKNAIVDTFIDGEKHGREIEVLKPFEEVVDEPEGLS